MIDSERNNLLYEANDWRNFPGKKKLYKTEKDYNKKEETYLQLDQNFLPSPRYAISA